MTYVDTDLRGSTCHIVLVDGEDVGWVRASRGVLVATVKWPERRRKRVQDVPLRRTFEPDQLDVAVRWVVGHRGQIGSET